MGSSFARCPNTAPGRKRSPDFPLSIKKRRGGFYLHIIPP
jgi:hypothetical protein